MSGDIRSLGKSGQAVFNNAQKLQKAGLINDAQFRELTNKNVGPQDVSIANQALDKIKADTPDAMNLMFSIPKMNNQILDLQKNQLGSDAKAAGTSIFDKLKDVGNSIGSFLGNFFSSIPDQKTIIQNIKA